MYKSDGQIKEDFLKRECRKLGIEYKTTMLRFPSLRNYLVSEQLEVEKELKKRKGKQAGLAAFSPPILPLIDQSDAASNSSGF